MHPLRLLAGLAFAILVGLLGISAGSNASGFPRVYVTPPEPVVVGGSTFVLTVRQNAGSQTAGAQATLTFDRTLVQVVDLVPASTYAGANFLVGIDSQTTAAAIAEANQSTGVLLNAAAYFNPGTSLAPSGDQPFLIVTMTALTGVAGVSPLALSQVEILGANYAELPVTSVTNGYIGIAHASGDADADGVLDTVDNCPADQNPSQRNDDANFVDMTPPLTADDKTWPNSDAAGSACDTDDDNDGITDADEADGGTGCTSITDSLLRDTDGDRFLDGAECTLGTNPTLASSKPLLTACGPTGDADGDRIGDRIEVCHYGTDPANNDTDGDKSTTGARDGCEVASLNADRIVNVADQGILASFVGGTYPYHVGADINKDGNLNPADQGILASLISPAGQCP